MAGNGGPESGIPSTGLITQPCLVLASASPRRRELLEGLGLQPLVEPADLDEQPHPGENPFDLVVRLAEQKALAVSSGKNLTIGADTEVIIDGRALGKPASAAEARRMLLDLSGRTHTVATGIAVVCNGEVRSTVAVAEVTIRHLQIADVEWYIDLGEWEGKAGGYAVQGAGGLLVEVMNGHFHTVIGMPLVELDGLLESFGRPIHSWVGER